jgi:hypothetical protein
LVDWKAGVSSALVHWSAALVYSTLEGGMTLIEDSIGSLECEIYSYSTYRVALVHWWAGIGL